MISSSKICYFSLFFSPLSSFSNTHTPPYTYHHHTYAHLLPSLPLTHTHLLPSLPPTHTYFPPPHTPTSFPLPHTHLLPSLPSQILFVVGIVFIIGVERTISFFFQPHKLKGTACFFGGILLVLLGWAIIGMIVESYGAFVLFG